MGGRRRLVWEAVSGGTRGVGRNVRGGKKALPIMLVREVDALRTADAVVVVPESSSSRTIAS